MTSSGSLLGLDLRQERGLSMTQQLRQAIGLLRYGNAELADHLRRIAAANPALRVLPERPAETPGGPLHPAQRQAVTGGAGAGTEATEATVAGAGHGLHAHVLHQIAMGFVDAENRRVAEVFARGLEPSGWLRPSVAEVAAEANCSLARAEAVLERLQQFEPPGIFARSLVECLRLQAADAGLLGQKMATVLDHLDLLGRGAMAALAELCGGTEADVAAILRQIRSFNPKPGAAFVYAPEPIRPPDVIVTPRAVGSWQVDLNLRTAPGVVVVDPGAGAFEDDAAYRAAMAEARWLDRAVSRRNATTLRVVSAVVAWQAEFLRHGPGALRPLGFADVARTLSIHESTVSRVTSGLMVELPGGCVPLRSLFSVGLAGRGARTAESATAVRHRLARILAEEDRFAPLSDAALAERLGGTGTVIARRTVAKYRRMLGIPSAAGRRAQAGRAAARVTGA
jgi:RNA polymerase sigma-54 factor